MKLRRCKHCRQTYGEVSKSLTLRLLGGADTDPTCPESDEGHEWERVSADEILKERT